MKKCAKWLVHLILSCAKRICDEIHIYNKVYSIYIYTNFCYRKNSHKTKFSSNTKLLLWNYVMKCAKWLVLLILSCAKRKYVMKYAYITKFSLYIYIYTNFCYRKNTHKTKFSSNTKLLLYKCVMKCAQCLIHLVLNL